MDTKKGQLDYGYTPKKETLSSYIKHLEDALEELRINEAKAYNRKQPIDRQYIKALEYQVKQFLISLGKKHPDLLADPMPQTLQDMLIRLKKVKDTKGKKVPKQTEKLTPTQRKLRRQADMASILKKRPKIGIVELAKDLDVSPSTVSRDGVWRVHRRKLTKEKFLRV